MHIFTNLRIVFHMSLLIFFTGCGVYITHFKAVDFNDINKDYTIDAKMYKEIVGVVALPNDVKEILYLYINNQLVLEAPVQYGKLTFSTKSMYENKQLTVDCYRQGLNPEQHNCQVHLDQRKIGSFKLITDNY
mgnify:CR=1 FL=1